MRRGRTRDQYAAVVRARMMPRNRAIHAAWRNGVPVAELAALHGLTRQRIHQILAFVDRLDRETREARA